MTPRKPQCTKHPSAGVIKARSAGSDNQVWFCLEAGCNLGVAPRDLYPIIEEIEALTPEERSEVLAHFNHPERERAARIVERWHINKGGYTELAHKIRSGT